MLVALHSFTPVFKGVSRPWHVAVLFNRDPRLAACLWQNCCAPKADLMVGENEPYRGQRPDRLHRPGAWRAARPAACRDRNPPGPDHRPGGPEANGPSAWRACCPPPTPSSCADERTEPRGADRSGPRGIADHRCPELLRRAGAPGKAEYFRRSLRDTVLPNIRRLQIRLPERRHRGRLFGDREHDPRRPRPQPRLQDLRHRRAARLVGGAGARRDRAGRRRDDLPQDVEQRLHLDQYRLRTCAISRCAR